MRDDGARLSSRTRNVSVASVNDDILAFRRENLYEQTYRIIRKALMAGQFPPGHVLRLRPLAEELGISVTPVREALLRLASEHALSNDGRTLRVPMVDVKRFREIRDLRILLEGRAAAQGAANATSATVETLEALQRRIRDLRKARDFSGALAVNEEFHFTVYGAADMPVLYDMIEGLWVQIGPILTRIFQFIDAKVAANHPHEGVIEAFRARDGAAARNAIETDILWAARNLEPTLQADRSEAAAPTG